MTEEATRPPQTTGEVAHIFGVSTMTVKRWADAGRLPYFRTPGGHYRFHTADVDAFRASLSEGSATISSS